MAPAVLWIDEIEKGFGRRRGTPTAACVAVLGSFDLDPGTQGQGVRGGDRQRRRLPAELLRKGRFDEIFFVDLPTPPVRETIFRLHLSVGSWHRTIST